MRGAGGGGQVGSRALPFSALVVLCVVLLVGAAAAMPLMGGYNDEKPVTEDVHKLVEQVRGEAENALNGPVDKWHPVSYKKQVVAGTNYMVKVETGDDKFAHVTIFEPLPHTGEAPKLTKVEGGKGRNDALA
eukprot:jgi/Chlat1/5826/Chrsp4S06361